MQKLIVSKLNISILTSYNAQVLKYTIDIKKNLNDFILLSECFAIQNNIFPQTILIGGVVQIQKVFFIHSHFNLISS